MKTLTCSWCDAPNAPGATTCASCGAPLREEGARLVMESVARALPPDTVLRDGDYKILAILGQGGFGITYRALNSRLGREVAIKEFFPSSCDREGLLVSPSGGTTAIDYENGKAAFLSEARVLARFDHPAIVRVFGAWEENRSAYMEMELLRGQTLAHVLDQYRRLSPNDVLRLFNPILDALQVLHNEGYLHRDIKPQNLMLCGVAQGATDAEHCVRHARAVLLDFGAAHHVGSGASQALSVVVTPGYAPLEQYAVRARRGAFTDIYALCATLYHALSGQAPPPASDRAIGQALTPLEDLVSGLPKEWYAAIAAGLQTEIAKRPQSVGELRALMGGQNPSVPPPYQPYQSAPKPYGANDLSALINQPGAQTPQLGANHPNSQAQSLIAQSLLNAVPDPNAPQVLAPPAPNYNPQHPLGSNASGAPVALSQPSGAVPLVPPQASQTAGHQPSTAQQHAQNQAQQNNVVNDVRMRQIAALLYLGSPIVFAFLWWLFAVSSGGGGGPHYAPVPPPPQVIPPPITRPYNPPPAPSMSSQADLPKMRFSLANSAQSSLKEWSDKSATITNTALSPDGKWAAGIDSGGTATLWDVETGQRRSNLLRLNGTQTAHFSFAPDSSKLMIHEINVSDPRWDDRQNPFLNSQNPEKFPRKSILHMIDVATRKTLWSKKNNDQIPAWSNNSSRLNVTRHDSSPLGWVAASGKPFSNYNGDTAYYHDPETYYSDDGIWAAELSRLPIKIRTASGRKSWHWGLVDEGYFSKDRLWFAPDSRWIMAGIISTSAEAENKHIIFRDIETGKVISDWQNEPSSRYKPEFDFTISPKGRYVVIRNGTNALRIWNVREHGDLILQWDLSGINYYGPFVTHSDAQLLGNRLFFSPDESKIVMIDGDRRVYDTIRLIDITTRKVREMKKPSVTSRPQFQWTPDGKSIAWIDSISGKMGRLKLSDFKTAVSVQVLAGGPPKS